jgi:tetratricopeptide (TPR) repeat protein
VALMAIKGSLKEASLPDVIQLLFLGRRSGCLSLANRQEFGTIYFDEGQVVWAAVVNRRDRLGDLLVRSGRLTPDQLRAATDRHAEEPGRRLGEILVELGLLSPGELDAYVRRQVEEAIYYLFTWTAGTFNFEAGVRPDREPHVARIPPDFLLLEGARRVDEWGLIEKKVPSLDLVFAADREQLAALRPALTPEQEELLPLLDGSRDVRQLVDESGLAEFEVGKALYGLITAGYAHRVGSSAAAAPRPSDARILEHRNLGVAFYKAGMLDEAGREFRRVAELQPSEASAPFYLGLIALRQDRAAEAVEAFRDAVAKGGPRAPALHNLGLALERVGRLDDAEAAYREAAAWAADDPRVALGWAVIALKRGDHAAARDRLGRVVELLAGRPLPAVWYWAATLTRVGLGDAAGALGAARDGVAAHPASAVLRNNLAVLLELAGDAVAAEAALRAALAEDPAVPQVSKNLADLLYRAGRYDEAKEAYERAARLDPALGDDLYFKLGNIAYKRREPERARECWSRAAALNPAHELARANLRMLEAAR